MYHWSNVKSAYDKKREKDYFFDFLSIVRKHVFILFALSVAFIKVSLEEMSMRPFQGIH